MEKNSKIIFWGFLNSDYKAMKKQLENMAKKGWKLENIRGLIAKFKAIPPQDIEYYVDVFPSRGVFDADNSQYLNEYRRLCEESGWSFITSRGHLQFFCSLDKKAVPIHTDIKIEEQIIKNTILRSEYLSVMIFLFATIFNIFIMGKFDYTNLLTYSGVTTTFIYPLFILPMLLWLFYIITWNMKLRKYVKKGEPIPIPPLKSAKFRANAYYSIIFIFGIIMILTFLGDALAGEPLILIALIPLLVSIIVGMALKKFLKVSNKRKRNKIIIVSTVIIITVILLPIATISILSGNLGTGFEKIEKIPEEYKVLKLEDFPFYEKADLKIRRFEKKSSPIVPKQIDYWEIDENGLSVRFECYKAITPYFANMIFKGKLEDEARYYEMISASTTKWDAD